MTQPAKCSSARGVLLVEAALSAVVIGVGLVFISQGLSNQLKALTSIEEASVRSALAERRLVELDAERLAGVPLPPEPSGRFDEPGTRYEWILRAVPRPDVLDKDGQPLFSDVTCAVRKEAKPHPFEIRRTEIWRTSWVPASWF